MNRRAFVGILSVVATTGTIAVVVKARQHGSSHDATTIPVSSAHLATIDSAGMSIGPLDARVVVRILGDYECGACQQLDATAGRELRQLAASQSLRYTYIHAPLAIHRRGPVAAAAAYCAADQDHPWTFHQALSGRTNEWAAGEPAELQFEQYAIELGLDANRFSICLEAPTTHARVQRDRLAAIAAGQSYVPVVVIGDSIIRGASAAAILTRVRHRLAQTESGSTPERIGQPPDPNRRAVAVTVAPVRRGDLAVSVEAAGTVRARRTAVLRAEVSSSVTRLAAKEGELVRAGEVVATFDRTSLALALRDAVLRRDQARLGFDEATLFDDRIADPALREARARHARLRSGLAAAELGVTRARLDLDHSELRSPFNGIITRLHVHTGDVVRPGQEVAEVAALDTVYVEAMVLETDLPQIRAGAVARIEVPAHGARQLTGAVTAIATVVDSATRSGAVRIAVPHAGDRIRPGMFASVAIEVGHYRDRLIVPRSALLERDHRTLIFLFLGDAQHGRAQWRYVTVEAVGDSAAAIAPLAGDLPIGSADRVITSGHSALVHEALVRLTDSLAS